MLLENVVLGKQKTSQQTAQLGIGGTRRLALQIVQHARVRVELFVLILREIVDFGVVAQPIFARAERLSCPPAT